MSETFVNANIERRSVLKAAAWSAPVIATAAAVPMAAASEEPDATFVQYLWDQVAPTGVQSQFALYGRASDGGQLVDAVLPSGTFVTFYPPEGGTVSIGAIYNGSQVANDDGSITVFFTDGLIEALAYPTFHGATGTGRAVFTVPGLENDVELTQRVV